MFSEVILEWEIDNSKIYHNIPLNSSSLLVSNVFLQSLLPPAYHLSGVSAIIDESTFVQISSIQDMDKNVHYLLDSSMSNRFSLVVIPISVCDSFDSFNSSKTTKKQATPCYDLSSSSTEGHFETTHQEGVSRVIKNEESPCQVFQSVVSYISSYAPPSILKSKLAKVISKKQVKEIPRSYDGDCVLEFPPTFGEIGNTHGMEQKYDGHLWTRPTTSNMALECTVRVSYCIGTLECHRNSCTHYINNKKYNNSFFHGHLSKKIAIGLLAIEEKSKITCHYCRKPAYCVETCKCMVYYVMPHDKSMTRMMLHLGNHMHQVQPSTSMAMIENTKLIVSKMLQVDRTAGPRKIQMNVAKEMIFSTMVEEGAKDQTNIVGDVELYNFLEELVPLVENQRYDVGPPR